MDDRFIVEEENGFTYWAGDFATRVFTDIGVFRASQSVYRVTAETDLLKGRGHVRELALALEEEMDQCSFSGPVYDQVSDTFRMYTAVYATSDHDWLKKTFSAALALQIAEANDMARRLSQKFKTTSATSAHPQSGIRTAPDPVLSIAYSLFHPSGDHPSAWENVPEWEQAGWILEREARNYTGDRKTHLTAEFDWACGGDDGMNATIRTDDPHPKLGNGLHVTLTVPMRLSAEAIGHLVLDLNTNERLEYKRCHTLGSWCAHDGKLAFREFVPNSLYAPEYLEEVCVNVCTRAIWANEWFYEMKCKAQATKA
jgi:hypothetical protein